MANNTQPIHIGTVNAKPIRFFVAPEGEPPPPWCSAEDLLHALGYNTREQVQIVLRANRALETRQFATGCELLEIVSIQTAETAIHTSLGYGSTGEAILAEFQTAARLASDKLLAALPAEARIEAMMGRSV